MSITVGFPGPRSAAQLCRQEPALLCSSRDHLGSLGCMPGAPCTKFVEQQRERSFTYGEVRGIGGLHHRGPLVQREQECPGQGHTAARPHGLPRPIACQGRQRRRQQGCHLSPQQQQKPYGGKCLDDMSRSLAADAVASCV